MGGEETLAFSHPILITISLTPIRIQYDKIDNISIQFNFTTIAYIGSLKETLSQDRHQFILGNPLGEENPTNLHQYR